MKESLLLSLLIFGVATAFGQTTSVLFLGNSYTGTNGLPQKFYDLSLAAGDTVFTGSNTPGGHTLEGHSANATSINKIFERDWDFVVLQEQSQRPSFPPNQVANEVFPYAEILCDTIRANFECTEPVFYMTWGRRSGDQMNCQNYEPLCTFEGMSTRLRSSYLEMAEDNEARVAPCGAAWSALDIADTTMFANLYTGDGSHPSHSGQYLNACVFYATIFRKSPVGIPYYSNLAQADAETLQQLAHEIVIDSLDNWNINVAFPEADPSYSEGDFAEIQFSQNSIGAVEHFWDFGDGNTSTEADPFHIYAQTNAVYEVIYVAINSCGRSDTTHFNVITSWFSIDEPSFEVRVKNYGDGVYQIKSDNHLVSGKLESLDGRTVSEMIPSTVVDVNLSNERSGIYLLSLFNEDGIRRIVKLTR